MRSPRICRRRRREHEELSMKVATVRRWVFGLGAALALGATASAQQAPGSSGALPPTYALLSLVGDQFTVVIRREETGSRLDQNVRRSYPIDGATLDDIALGVAEDVVKRLKPVSPVLRFSIRDPRLFELQDKLLVDSTESRALRAALGKLSRDHQVARLVVVTKLRDDAQFKLRNTTTGTGKISGLGFYVDPYRRPHEVETSERASEFLGPFAYVTVTVLNAESMAPIRSVPARESEMEVPVHSSGAVSAWDTLTPEAKVDALERVLRRAVEKATAAAIAD
jgi:hypothetical protein